MADQFAEYYKDYESGYLLRDAQVGIVRAFKLTGLFPKQEIPTKKVNVINSTPIDKFVDKTGKMKKMAKGTKARKIVGEVETAGGLSLTHSEIEYIIENEVLEEPTFNLQDEILAMSYVVGLDIEEVVYNACKASALIAPDSSKLNKNWDDAATTLDKIIGDVTEFEASAYDKPIDLNWFAYGNRANVELTKKCGVSVENYQIPQNEFVIKNSKNFMNAEHFYGGSNMADGEIFGGDINNPGLKIFYKNYSNPNVKNAPMPQGMEAFIPPVKMLMYDTSDKETEPQTIIKVAAAAGAYPIQKGNKLFRYADILSS